MSTVYKTLAQNPELNFRFGEKSSFNHKTREVVIGIGQLLKLGVTDLSMLDFVVMHEQGHFKELREDPRGYLSIISESQRSDGNGQVYFDFYNCLMDVYVNRNTRNLAPQYAGAFAGYSQDVKDLYQINLFSQRDFTSLPLCKQYYYYILNLAMGAGDDIKLSDSITAKIDNGVEFAGKKISYPEFIETYLVPVITTTPNSLWRATIGQRKQVIDLALKPIFEELLTADLKAGRALETPGFGNMEGIEPSVDDLKDAIEQRIADIEWEKMSPEERAKADQLTAAKQAAQNNGLNQSEAQGFAETLVKVRPIVTELEDILKLVAKKSTSQALTELPQQKSGHDLDMSAVIRNFGEVQTAPSRAPVFVSQHSQQSVQMIPQNIRLWLLPDLSGSMDSCITVVQEITVALAAAMVGIESDRRFGSHAIKGTISVIGFNDSAIEVIPMSSEATIDHVAVGFKRLSTSGGTNDHLALENCLSGMQVAPRSPNDFDLVIEITDGDTSDKNKSRALVERLYSKGANLIAFFIEGASSGENFKAVWQTGEINCGYRVRTAQEILPHLRGLLLQIFGEA